MQGISGLWKGYIPTLYRDVPFSAIYWCIYETFKNKFNTQPSPSLGVSFIGGAVAGSVSSQLKTQFKNVKKIIIKYNYQERLQQL